MASYNITGYVKQQGTDVGLKGLTVELYDDMDNPMGETATTSLNGFFQIVIATGVATDSMRFSVSDSAEVLLDHTESFVWTPEFTDEVMLYVDDDPIRTLKISGSVSSIEGIPANGISLEINEKEFRTITLLVDTSCDSDGNYYAELSTTDLTNYISGETQLLIRAYVDPGIYLASATIQVSDANEYTVNLTTTDEYTPATTKFDSTATLIDTITNGEPIDTFTQDEVRYIANKTKKHIGEVTRVVSAYKFGEETSQDPAFFSALMEDNGSAAPSVNPLINMREEDMRDAITRAVEKKKIPEYTPTEIDDFIAAAKAYQVDVVKNMTPEGETDTAEDVLMAVFGSSTDVTNYLNKANEQEYSSLADFWTEYEAEYGSTLTAKAQKGMVLVNITGYQPETTAHLMTVLGSNDVYTLGAWDEADWISAVSTVCTANSKLCVPAYIRGEETDPQDTGIQEQYAKILTQAVHNIYPLVYINAQLQAAGGDEIIEDNDARADAITFLSANPYFDLRRTAVQDINDADFDLTGVIDEEILKDALAPVQRVLRLTFGMPDAVVALIKDGLDSARAIVEYGDSKFVADYASLFGSEETALTVFGKADVTSTYAENHVINAITNSNVVAGGPVIPYMDLSNEEGSGNPIAEATMSTMFGNFDYCSCSKCLSMYSPAAYYTDMLNFIRKSEHSAHNPYNELMRRRPDLQNIELTCKNTNTLIPYIDLVIELLEKMIIEKYLSDQTMPAPAPSAQFPLLSFQTRGSAANIAAYPEHINTGGGEFPYYKLAYTDYFVTYNLASPPAPPNTPANTTVPGALNNAIYPNNLPFSLAIEETRTYMQYLGAARHIMMKLLAPPSSYANADFEATNELSNYARYADMLDLSKDATDIITHSHADSDDTYLFYGFSQDTGSEIENWPDPENSGTVVSFPSPNSPTPDYIFLLSNRLDVLLIQAGVTYLEMLQLLVTDFLNPLYTPGTVVAYRDINIKSGLKADGTDADADTCRIPELKLEFNTVNNVATPEGFFDKLYRLIRLYRTEKLTLYQWDVLLGSFDITSLDTVSKPTTHGANNDFELLGRALELSETLRIEPELLAGWWSDLSTTSYIDYSTENRENIPSIYAQIFDNQGVMSDPGYDIFKKHSSLSSYQYVNHLSEIASITRIDESELKSLLTTLGILNENMSVRGLSRVFSIGQIALSYDYSITDLILILKLSGLVGTLSDSITTIPPTASYTYTDALDALQKLVDTIAAIKDCQFTLQEINYLVRNVDTNSAWHPNTDDVTTFYNDLRDELLKLPVYTAPPSTPSPDEAAEATALLKPLVDTIYQQFSKAMNVSEQHVRHLLDPEGYPTYESTTTESFTMYMIEDSLFRSDNTEFNEATSNSDVYFDKYRLINKINFITEILKLSAKDFSLLYTQGLDNGGTIDFDFTSLFVDVDANYLPAVISGDPVPVFEGFLRLCRLIELRDKLSLTDTLKSSSLHTLLNINYSASTTQEREDAKTIWLRHILKNTGWDDDVVEDLIGGASDVDAPSSAGQSTNLLRLTFPDDYALDSYDNISNVLRVGTIISWCERTGLSPLTLHELLRPDVDLEDSRKVLLAAKGRQSDDSWQHVAGPLRDRIRIKQRDALTGYILANPPQGFAYQFRNKTDLYEYLLIDVETEPAVRTSRIKQAINSVQLFMTRLIMNLEYNGGSLSQLITVDRSFVREWSRWRKWYGIWQVNRELFLYPENWLEPTLRDDRTQFFKELQEELTQGELDADTAHTAYLNYLQKLDDVSNLEVVGCVEHVDAYGSRVDADGKRVVHVIGRTYGQPKEYFYRRLVDEVWTGWERMEIDILSDHIMPVCWRGRLYVFWVSFIDKKIKANPGPQPHNINPSQPGGYNYLFDPMVQGGFNSMWFYNDPLSISGEPDPNESDQKYYHQLEISLNWTEYKDGKWEKQRIAGDKIKMTLNPYLYKDFTEQHLDNPVGSGNRTYVGDFFKFLTKDFQMSFPELTKARFYMHHEFITSQNHITNRESSSLVISMLFPNRYIDTNETGMFFTQGFLFQNPGTDPVLLKDTFLSTCVVPPIGTAALNMGFHKYRPNNPDGGLFHDQMNNQAEVLYVYNSEVTVHVPDVRQRKGVPTRILGQVPVSYGTYTLRPKSNFYDHPLEDHFFYKDDKNSFFARKLAHPWPSLEPPKYFFIGEAGMNNHSSLAQINLQPQRVSGHPISSNAWGGAPVSIGHSNGQGLDYYMQAFYHAHTQLFLDVINADGLDGFFDLRIQITEDNIDFQNTYWPSGVVIGNPGNITPGFEKYEYPKDHVDFSPMAAYSVYNWELFYHIPMLIAQDLSTNQKFEEAQRWYHYIFDPTSNTGEDGQTIVTTRERFWKCRPFYEMASPGNQIETLSDLLKQINSVRYENYIRYKKDPEDRTNAHKINHARNELNQVKAMETSPLQPYAIARYRQLAFMKNTVLKYIENLIAWGDKLFTRNTIESINEATQIYILANNILGQKPELVYPRGEPYTRSFYGLTSGGVSGGLGAFNNAMVEVENYIDINAGVDKQNKPPYTKQHMFYFCIPENKEILKYWDTIADRLYKIRNSLSIKGQKQQLPLFQPPINPALLLRAAAAGLDLSDVLDNISGANAPNYRFPYYIQKAHEACNDAKALGSALLSAIEKKDAEELAILRTTLEKNVLDRTLEVKKAQIEEAKSRLEPLYRAKAPILKRIEYYGSRDKIIAEENQQFTLITKSMSHSKRQLTFSLIGSGLSLIPQFHLQVISAVGASFGGQQLNTIFQALSTRQGFKAAEHQTKAGVTNTKAGYIRRWDDWQFQADLARTELAPIDAQIIAVEAQIEVAEKDLAAFEVQIENNKAVDEFMRSKYTNKELYSWMISKISQIYFQTYQFAFKQAQTALKSYDYELPMEFLAEKRDQLIKFGYWDSLRKGLFAAEQLQLDLRKLEVAYAEDNVRELEMTKHVSLAEIDPIALLNLRTTGETGSFYTEKWMFDLDYPGHYYRRIKSVSVTVPCVKGPYTSVTGELSLSTNVIHKADGSNFAAPTIGGTLATSSAQNDNGMFEMNFRDERFLPFEGKGVVGSWSFSMMKNPQLRQFDYNTISDVIIHIKYTARSGGYSQALADDMASANPSSNLNPPTLGSGETVRFSINGGDGEYQKKEAYFSLKHGFSNAWNSGFGQLVANQQGTSYNVGRPFNINLKHSHFPFYCKGKTIEIMSAKFILIPTDPDADPAPQYRIETFADGQTGTLVPVSFTGPDYNGSASPLSWEISDGGSFDADLNLFETDNIGDVNDGVIAQLNDIYDIYIVFGYKLV